MPIQIHNTELLTIVSTRQGKSILVKNRTTCRLETESPSYWKARRTETVKVRDLVGGSRCEGSHLGRSQRTDGEGKKEKERGQGRRDNRN
jgi:hypothetical protein